MSYKKGEKVRVWSLQSFHGGGFLEGALGTVRQDQCGGSVLVEVMRNIDGKMKLDRSYEVYPKQIERVEDYHKPEPKKPTHTERMTKWWKHWDGAWSKVFAYFPEDKTYGFLIKQKDIEKSEYRSIEKYRSFVVDDYFIGRESADVPPEAQ